MEQKSSLERFAESLNKLKGLMPELKEKLFPVHYEIIEGLYAGFRNARDRNAREVVTSEDLLIEGSTVGEKAEYYAELFKQYRNDEFYSASINRKDVLDNVIEIFDEIAETDSFVAITRRNYR